VLLDVPEIEQQLLGLVWRGGKIDHQNGEHDDWANAAAGVVHELLRAEGISANLCPETGLPCPHGCGSTCRLVSDPESDSEAREAERADHDLDQHVTTNRLWFPGDD
jgi:hypothetical protein